MTALSTDREGHQPAAAAAEPSLPGITESALHAAFQACRDVTRTRARNFYYGLRLTPEPRRSAIYSIYAWMRMADDAVDNAGPAIQRRARLSEIRALTTKVLDPAERANLDLAALDPAWTALAATIYSYSLDRTLFDDMLAGLEEDVEPVWYENDRGLARYCYRVAGTVGLACVSIWGLRSGVDADPAEVRRLAELRGQAFQRTNILRDFAEDFDAAPRRIYIPRDAFDRVGLTPEDLRAWRRPDACDSLIAEQAAVARRAYSASEPLLSLIDPACAPTLWAMTRIYSGILARIEESPARIVSGKRIRLAAPSKAMIAIRASLRSRLARW